MDEFMKHEKVADAFVSAIQETKERLYVLNAYIEDNLGVSYEAVKWADVNTAKHVSDMFEEIIAFCNIPNTKPGADGASSF